MDVHLRCCRHPLCVLGLIALPEAKVFDLNALDMFFTLAPSLLFGAAFISVIFTS